MPTEPTRDLRLLTHGLSFVLGLLLAGGLGWCAVGREQARTAAQRDRAEEAEGVANARFAQAEANLARAVKAEAEAKENLKRSEANLKLAKAAVDEVFTAAKDHPALKGDDMQEVRRLLLEKALLYYKELRKPGPGEK